MKLDKLLAGVLLALCGSVCWAQETRAAVFVEDITQDVQGHRLAYAVKEQIRRSASMRLTDAEKGSGIQLRLGSINPDGDSNIRTSYSLAVTMTNFATPGGFPLYLDSTGGMCGSAVIEQCANSIVARVDSDLSAIRAAFQSGGK
jgi:hypothetical protein